MATRSCCNRPRRAGAELLERARAAERSRLVGRPIPTAERPLPTPSPTAPYTRLHPRGGPVALASGRALLAPGGPRTLLRSGSVPSRFPAEATSPSAVDCPVQTAVVKLLSNRSTPPALELSSGVASRS